MSKHTPWKVSTSHSGAVYVHTGPTWQEGTICKVELGGLAMGQQIAALPDLLAALQLVLVADSISPGDCYNPDGSPNKLWGSIDEAKAAARAAIAKATGGDL